MGDVTEQAVQDAHEKSSANMAQIVYILYLASLVLGITQLIGVIIAYLNKSDSPAWVASHYRYQIRTFWIGILYGLIGAVTMYIMVGMVILFLALIWFIIRAVKGLKYLGRKQAMPNPASWLW